MESTYLEDVLLSILDRANGWSIAVERVEEQEFGTLSRFGESIIVFPVSDTGDADILRRALREEFLERREK